MMKKILVFLFLLPAAALAREPFEFHGAVGGYAIATPIFEGAAQYTDMFLPLVDLDYGPFFASVIKGAGFYIPLLNRQLIFAPAMRWRVVRNLDPDGYGVIGYIRHIRPTTTLNAILNFDPLIFNFRITNGMANDDRGSSYNFGITYKYEINKKLDLAFYTTAIYGSHTYNQTYFGITPVESILYGYNEYTPTAGLKSIDFGVNMNYKLTNSVSLNLTGEILRLVGPAADSPIVVHGSPNQLFMNLAVSYNF